jgi:hypothetical protein
MGGVWERMIGITRRILDGILLQQNKKALTGTSPFSEEAECSDSVLLEVLGLMI